MLNWLAKVINEAILRDPLNFRRGWQHQNGTILRDFLQKWKISAEPMASCQCGVWSFQSMCLKDCGCHEKVRLGHTKCCTWLAKASRQTSRSNTPNCNFFSGNQRSDLLTSLSYCACNSRVPRLPLFFWECYLKKNNTFCSLLARCRIPCACHTKRHMNVQKCSVPLSFLHSWLRNVLRATTACTFWTGTRLTFDPTAIFSHMTLPLFCNKVELWEIVGLAWEKEV